MPSPMDKLLGILDLEPLERNLFRGRSFDPGWRRVFGGQVIAQALAAATRTVDERPVHSLHAYFLLAGDPKSPIVYEVDRIRDGKSFTTRRVVAIQHGEPIFSMSASFHREEAGAEHQIAMPDVPPPESLPNMGELAATVLAKAPAGVRQYFERERPVELRPVDLDRYHNGRSSEPRQRIWVRATETLPDEPALHRLVLAYASDMTLLDTALVVHGLSVFDPRVQCASLDHALWFHRPFRADDWLLYVQDSPWTGDARGIARGQIFTREGILVASVAQEGLLRPIDPAKLRREG